VFENFSGRTRLFPIIGDPIQYVQSPQSLTRGFEARGHNGICVPMQVVDGDLDAVMGALAKTRNVDGLLITMPHKFAAFDYCATTSQTARLLGCVSVMRRNLDGSWHGDMLDGRAFLKAQLDAGAQPEGARVLLVGAGGAGSAIAIALLESGVRQLVICDTDETRVAGLMGDVSALGRGRVTVGSADPTGFDMVSNATPMGMGAGDPLPIQADLLTSSTFVGDVIAGHGVTPLLLAAQAAGCKTANGDEMVMAVQETMLAFMLHA
jgi:shikimate dehydrogenase